MHPQNSHKVAFEGTKGQKFIYGKINQSPNIHWWVMAGFQLTNL